ncbi:two-component system response regulator BtsR [Salinivibrio kushneri]|uniref:two-component system response regulator BtsR n=1 Tax=Salinivibrio kushneri TaxID=1908198 RepID=UPI000984DB50|nr:two-component system response regulator BtsR [Salinivibrio kushneri]OOE51010.1 two-component system response regulator YehT [Salinivibrio kushneri]OOE56708.1 two-component system response regulator YehT [Salinivibrio kushneri]OOE60610.1 two-component system response regulator YehT [Salinivibrio kushneri]
MIKALIVDDELHAREALEDELLALGGVEVVGQCNNAIDALKTINQSRPDVVFLDIQMPRVTGLELLAMLDPDTMPKVVFVTAYDEYAVQAFEENAFDYLLKPVETERLKKSLEKLTRELSQKHDYQVITPTLDLLPCAGHNRITLIPHQEVEVARTALSGVALLTAKGESTTHLSLKVLEDKTPLIRCHRQYLVHPAAIREIQLLDNGLAEVITQSAYVVPVSRRYLKTLKDKLGLCQ